MIIKGTSLEDILLTKAKETIEYYKNDVIYINFRLIKI